MDSPPKPARMRSQFVGSSQFWSETGYSSDEKEDKCNKTLGKMETERSADLSSVARSICEARSVLDEVAPWVGLGSLGSSSEDSLSKEGSESSRSSSPCR